MFISKQNLLGGALFAGIVLNAVFLDALAQSQGPYATSRRVLRGHVPAATAGLASTGDLPPTRRINLALGLKLDSQKEGALQRFINDIYNPQSPNFRHYLKTGEFAERFAPRKSDYEAVKDFAKKNGLTVTMEHSNRLILDVSGPAAAVESAFHVGLKTYHYPRGSGDFYAPDREPTVEDSVPVEHVGGLDNFARPFPKICPHIAAPNTAAVNGSGPGGTSYMGYDFRAAYVPGTALTGSGQTIGLLEFDGFYMSDIASYISQAGLTNETTLSQWTNSVIQTVLLDDFNGTPTTGRNSGNDEVSLDMEMAIAMAPGMSNLIVYEAGPSGSLDDIISRMASDNVAKQISCSWGLEFALTSAQEDTIYKQMAAQGQSFFVAAGDSDAFTASNPPEAPADTTNAIQVGGTEMTTTGPAGSWVGEIVWNLEDGTGSCGGICSNYGIPSWQVGINMKTNLGSTSYHNVPDVAANAYDVYNVYGNGTNYDGTSVFDGTSAAAPLWAGFAALANQRAAISGQQPVGFFLSKLYSILGSANYADYMHDITSGDNKRSGSGNNFPATTGYDLCTGVGTPNIKLISFLVPPAAPTGLLITP